MSDKLNVLVCGTNFGKFYSYTCDKSEKLNLTGIISRGSKSSRKEAADRKTVIYTDIESIDEESADLAVVAARTIITGGKSADTVKKLLEKNIPVLQEQPVHIQEIQEIKSKLSGKDTAYFVNNFYRFLPAVENFVKYSKRVISEHRLLRIRMSCSSQLLYPLIDVIYEMLGGVKHMTAVKVFDANMNVLTGTIDEIPFVLEYYNEYSDDVDGSLALFFDIKIDTSAGNLILNDPEGSVVWQSHLSYERDKSCEDESLKGVKPIEMLFDSSIADYHERYSRSWPDAMEKSLIHFAQKASSAAGRKELEERMLKQCEFFSVISNAAGRPEKTETEYESGVSLI